MYRHGKRLPLLLGLSLLTSGCSLWNTAVVERNGLASCPPGCFIVGAGSDDQPFRCARGFGRYSVSEEVVVQGTQNQGVLNCPPGMGMTGLEGNRASCAPGRSVQLIPGFWNLSQECPRDRFVTAVDLRGDLFQCGWSDPYWTGFWLSREFYGLDPSLVAEQQVLAFLNDPAKPQIDTFRVDAEYVGSGVRFRVSWLALQPQDTFGWVWTYRESRTELDEFLEQKKPRRAEVAVLEVNPETTWYYVFWLPAS